MSDLWLHGFTGSPASFDRLADALPEARALRPWLTGHGPHPAPVRTFDDEVLRLAALAGGGPRRLLGYSLGARLALALALDVPGLARSLVLVGVSAGIDDVADRRARAASDDALAGFLEDEGIEAFADRWEAQPLFASQAELPEPLRAARRAERRRHEARALAASLRALSKGRMPFLGPRLAALEVPVALVVGSRDPAFLAEAERIAARVPRPQIHVVAGAGHDVVLERPDALAAILRGMPGP